MRFDSFHYLQKVAPYVVVLLLSYPLQAQQSGTDLPSSPVPVAEIPNKTPAQPSALTPAEKFHFYVKNTTGPAALFRAGAVAGLSQWRDDPQEWGQGAHGYGRRLGSQVGLYGIKNMVEFGVAVAHQEDPRYFRCKGQGVWRRTRYAILQTFVRTSDSGAKTVAVGRFAGAYSSGFISTLWYPDSANKVGDGLRRANILIGLDVGRNLLSEFWADVRRKILRRRQRNQQSNTPSSPEIMQSR